MSIPGNNHLCSMQMKFILICRINIKQLLTIFTRIFRITKYSMCPIGHKEQKMISVEVIGWALRPGVDIRGLVKKNKKKGLSKGSWQKGQWTYKPVLKADISMYVKVGVTGVFYKTVNLKKYVLN